MFGEGEHKIYEYIRTNSEYHKDSTTVIYGLDADLIMLTLNHLKYCNNMFLFRETPHFISHIDNIQHRNFNTGYELFFDRGGIIENFNNNEQGNKLFWLFRLALHYL